jgi:peptide/nickel transport system permease protein
VVLGPDARARPEDVAAIRAAFGLDEPAPLQYARWIGHVLTGDLGTSFRTGRSLTQELALRLPVTIELTVLAAGLGMLPALLVGILAAVRRNSGADYIATISTLIGVSVPNFLLATLLVLVFSLWLRWLPPIGYVELRLDPLGNLRTMLLPALSLGLPFAAIMMRITRSSVLEVLGQDHVRVARAKGLPPPGVLSRHVLPNAAIPVITVAGIQIARLLGGAVIVEAIFGLPGIGRYVYEAISTRDYPVVQGVTLVVALAFVLLSLVVDVLYAVVDPRLRTAN